MPCDSFIPMQVYLRILCGLVFPVLRFGGSIPRVSTYSLWSRSLYPGLFVLPCQYANERFFVQ